MRKGHKCVSKTPHQLKGCWCPKIFQRQRYLLERAKVDACRPNRIIMSFGVFFSCFNFVMPFQRDDMVNPTCGRGSTSSRLLLLTEVLDNEDDDLRCRIAGVRLSSRSRGRISRFSAGSTRISGMMLSESELERLRDLEELSRREGKRAWTICIVRTTDILM